MERLTARDKKGRAYFDDDGSLIRGANGTFHQKKDMTGQFIHQRFVALDKAIDRLVAYEDTGLEPQEIMAIIFPPNLPLTLDKLLKMDGEPVFVTSAIGEQPMWYIVDVEENELKNPWDRITLDGWDEGYPYKAYRRKSEEESR